MRRGGQQWRGRVPEENWLPLNGGDYGIDVVLRLYVPDLEKFENWVLPTAKKL